MQRDPHSFPDECTRCKKPFEDSHPWALGVVDFHTPKGGSPDWETGRSFICALCIIAVAEVLCPSVTGKPSWTAEKDQVIAEIRNYQRGRGK